jgi:vancomycin resistance protein YoaR
VIIAVLILAAGYAAACFYFADRVPKGTVVAGSQIGGLTATEATAKLESDLADRSRQPVQAAAGDQTVSFDPVVAGLGFSAAETVNSVTGLDFRPAWLWRQITGLGEVRPVLQVNSQALESEIAQLASQVRIAPVDATLAVTSGQVVATEPANGTDLDATTAASYVKESYLVNPGPWDLPTEVRAPRIGQAELDRATAEIAQPVLSAPVSVTVGTATVELPVASFAPAALIQAPTGSDELELTWDATLLAAAVNQRLPEGLVTNPVDARFVFTGDQVAIEDGAPGTELDATALAGAMTPAAVATGAARTANALLREVDPAAGRAELEKMGVKEVVGRFETQATNDADRTRNLRKAAEMVTGTLIPPGETFSLDKALGHRALETGWFNAGVVIGGLSREGIGGGLSQFSTTLYNASHLAGMVDVAHVPHANYFSRYPTGREATLWEGQIDNQFKNDTPYGVVLRAGVTSSLRVWVELWSTKYWTVEAQIGQPYSYVAPRTIESRAADCQPQSAGSSGFQVDYWRIRTDPDGKAQAQENWHWRYDPMNAVVCLETP